MYHRRQLTVYERMLNIEPALTKVFKRILAPQKLRSQNERD
jgi:hypothetical protein